MKNTFGNSITLTLFGESHGPEIGAVIDGLCPGIAIDEKFINHQLDLRRPYGKISTQRVEKDNFKIVSGVFKNKTTGAPLTILIPNENIRSEDYTELRNIPRPSHADYTAFKKYNGFEDYRGGGHFSGRLTAPIVAASAILLTALKSKGIKIATHIKSCGDISDRDFEDPKADSDILNDLLFPVLDKQAETRMKEKIEKAAEEGDSVGGILETIVTGMPTGVGEPWFDSVESVIAKGIFAIPAVKGIEFGAGFSFSEMNGSKANDQIVLKNGEIQTETNNNGGINGGITNGMPIIFRTVIKPTPSIFKKQRSVDINKMTEENLLLKGRHDPAIFHRARVVIDSVTALATADLLALKYGTDWFTEE